MLCRKQGPINRQPGYLSLSSRILEVDQTEMVVDAVDGICLCHRTGRALCRVTQFLAQSATSMCTRADRNYDHTLPEFLRLRSYSHLLFNPTLILFPPGGLGVAGGSENTLELNEVVLALKVPVLALNVLVL